MNKKIIALSALPLFAFANQNYVTILNAEYTANTISPTGEFVCDNFDITESDIYKGETATQTGSNCKEKSISGEQTYWNDAPDQVSTITGTHLESNCKNILAFNNSLPSKDYTISVNSTEINVTCDMTTDNGGWTLLTEQHFVSGGYIAPMVSIDDHNMAYSEVLYFDLGSSSSYGGGSPNWNWSGIEVGRQAFQFSNDWYSQAGAFEHVCNLVPTGNRLSSSQYRVIEGGNSNCHYGTSKINTCYNKVAVTVPAGKRIKGFRDVESIDSSGGCSPDNSFNLNYKILVR